MEAETRIRRASAVGHYGVEVLGRSGAREDSGSAATERAVPGRYAVLGADLLTGGWERVRDDVEVKRVPVPGGVETYVLHRATARREKEKAIRSRLPTQVKKVLGGLAQRVAMGRLKDWGKFERQLWQVEALYPSVADLCRARLVRASARQD